MFSPDEVRVIGHAAPMLLKMLREAEARVINTMYGEFQAGRLDQLQNLARLAALRDIQHQITNAESALQKEKNP